MCGPSPIPCEANMFASCTKRLSVDSCASLVPLGIKWACICAEKKRVLGGVVCLCYVFLCVLVCIDMLCSVLSSLGRQWLFHKTETPSVIVDKLPLSTVQINSKKSRIKSRISRFQMFRKPKTRNCNHFRQDGMRTHPQYPVCRICCCCLCLACVL